MYRYLAPMLFIFASAPLHAADAHELERLQRQCKIEQGSLLRDCEGTPSCDQLDRLYHRRRETGLTVNTTPQPPKAEAEPERFSEYRWNGMYQKHCYHDKEGNASLCF